MKNALKWAGYGLAGVVGACALAVGGAFVASEAMLRWPVEKPRSTLVASMDPGAVARGARVAKLNGCHDCHGAQLEGKLFHDEPAILRAWGPNLSRDLAHSDADFDRAVRHGVGLDGRRLWMMPSNAFAHLTDQEMADLMAYLRTYKPTGEVQPRFQVGHLGRLGVLLGKFRSEADLIRANGALQLVEAGAEHDAGRRIARACIECHGPALQGSSLLKAPDLSIAAAYDAEDFARLMKTGVAAGDRKVGLMTAVSRDRFSALTTDEVAALHGYLKARAQRQIAAANGAAAVQSR
jgi:mono/diheme cytochrome c family protein